MFKLKSSIIAMAVGASALTASFFSAPVAATPWADSEDLRVRHYLQVLTDAGAIDFSASTYPVMWGALLEVLRDVDTRALNSMQQQAYTQVMAVLEFHQAGGYTGGWVRGQTELGAERGYGQRYHEQAAIGISRELKGEHYAARLQTSVRHKREPLPGRTSDPQQLSFAGSYVASIVSNPHLGSWVVSADQLYTWWSPSYENDGLHTVSERPLQALRLTRAGASSLEHRALNWLGPWSATAYVGRSERALGLPHGDSFVGTLVNGEEDAAALGERHREEAFGVRVTANPHTALQLGARFTGSHLLRTSKNAALDARWVVFSRGSAGSLRAAEGSAKGSSHSVQPYSLAVYGELITHQSDFNDSYHTLGADFTFASPLLNWLNASNFSSNSSSNYGSNYGSNISTASPARVFVEYLDHQDREVSVVGFSQFAPSGFGIDTRLRDIRYRPHFASHEGLLLRPMRANIPVGFSSAAAGTLIGGERQQFDVSIYVPFRGGRLVTGAQVWRDSLPTAEGSTNSNHVNVFVDWEIRW